MVVPDAPADVPEAIRRWARRRLGSRARRGFGYVSWVFMSEQSALKIDPVPGREDRFARDKAVSRMVLPEVAVPRILDEGSVRGHAWIETTRLQGEPAYLGWPDMDPQSRRRFMNRLVRALQVFHASEQDHGAFPTPATTWQERLRKEAAQAVARTTAFLPGDYRVACEKALDQRLRLVGERPHGLIHGDLWLGNLLVNECGSLVGFLDFDKAERAPEDYELATLVRFWRYPWDFVPEPLEAQYGAALDFDDISEVVAFCRRGLTRAELEARLELYELIYRLKKVAEFGWSGKHQMMVNTVLQGAWCVPMEGV